MAEDGIALNKRIASFAPRALNTLSPKAGKACGARTITKGVPLAGLPREERSDKRGLRGRRPTRPTVRTLLSRMTMVAPGNNLHRTVRHWERDRNAPGGWRFYPGAVRQVVQAEATDADPYARAYMAEPYQHAGPQYTILEDGPTGPPTPELPPYDPSIVYPSSTLTWMELPIPMICLHMTRMTTALRYTTHLELNQPTPTLIGTYQLATIFVL